METSAPGIAGAIDGCSPLAIHQYEAVLRQAAAQLGQPATHFLQELNADRLRVVRDSSLSFSLSKLCEEYVQPTQVEQRLAMCIVVHGDLAHKSKKRAGGLPDGVQYEGNAFPGRINFLPSDRTTVALIGKQSANWRRREHGVLTHQVSAHQVRLVQPNPALQRFRALITAVAPAESGGGVVVTVDGAHPFKTGKNVVSLLGLHPSLDGHLEVFKSETASSFLVKGVRLADVDFGALNAALAQPGSVAYAEEQYTLYDELRLIHIIVSREQPAAAGAQAAAAAGHLAAGRAGQVGAAAGTLVPMTGVAAAALPLAQPGALQPVPKAVLSPPLMPGVAGVQNSALVAQVQQAQYPSMQQHPQVAAPGLGAGALPALPPQPFQQALPAGAMQGTLEAHAQQPFGPPSLLARLFGQVAPTQPALQQPQQQPAPSLAPGATTFIRGLLASSGPAAPAASEARVAAALAEGDGEPDTAESPHTGPGGSPAGGQGGGGSGGESGGGAGGSPQASRGSRPPAGAGGSGVPLFFFEKATVGGADPRQGPDPHPGQHLVVQGNALVTGGLLVEGEFLNKSDARRKEAVAAVAAAEVDACMKVAAGISLYTFRFKGRAVQQLGYMAQQVAQQVQQHGLEHFNLVQEDGNGELCLNMVGLLGLINMAVQGTMREVDALREGSVHVLGLAVGRLESQMGTLSAQLQRMQRAIENGSSSSSSAGCLAASGAAAPSPGGGLEPGEEGQPVSECSANSSSTLAEMEEDADELDSRLADAEALDADMAEEDDGAACAAGGAAGGAARAAGATMFDGMSDDRVVALLLMRLNEQGNPGCRALFKNFAEQLSRRALQELLEAATGSPAGLTAQGDRQRSLGGQFIKLAKKRLHDEKIRTQTASDGGLSDEQLRSYQLEVVQMARTGANLIVVAPTGAGKTAIPISLSAWLLQHAPSKRIVFLAPTVHLAQQQAAAFLSTRPFSAGTFHVDCRCGENPVTPAEWPGVLAANHVLVMTAQSLLNLLDSGHAHFDRIALLVLDECHHAKDDHSYAKVLAHYHRSSQETQIMGLTASPVSRGSMHGTYLGLDTLQKNLDATYVILDKNNPSLKEFVPTVHERAPIFVPTRPEDRRLGMKLGAFVLGAIRELHPVVGQQEDLKLPWEVQQMLVEGRWCSTAAIWCSRAAGQLYARPELGAARHHDPMSSLLLVRAAVAALALAGDTGYEAAVRHLSKECAAVAEKVVGPWEALTALQRGEAPSDTAYPCTLKLLRRLLGTLDLDTLQKAHECAFAGLSNHPKFLALKRVLLEKAALPAFHGIVFARTREAVRSLARIIQDCPELRFLEVFAFMGHGPGRRGEGGAKGMRVKEQQQVMEQFKAPGRKLLVSTSAGEEGIDVPNCEFVIRYTATQTGRERIQSRGRTRKAGSEYIQILEDGQERRLAAKSAGEEAHLHAALAKLQCG